MRPLLKALLLLMVIAIPAEALSDAEYLRFKKDPDFAQADRELTQAYNEAKSSMSRDDFAELREAQREWIEWGRDEHARQLMRHDYTRLEAYTEATRFRTQEIRDAMTLSTLSTDDFAGYFDNGDDIYLSVRWVNRAEGLFEVSLSCRSENWTGRGQVSGRTITAENGGSVCTL